MNAKELAEKVRRVKAPDFPIVMRSTLNELADCIATDIEQLIPRYRQPQPSDSGRWCFLEELPSDAPPTLVRSCGRSVREIVVADDVRLDYVPIYQYWTTAGWRELTGNVWPCERPEAGK